MLRAIGLFLLSLVFFLGISGSYLPAHALKFSPFKAQFKPVGSEANQLFRLENNSDQFTAVQVTMFKREIDFNGEETRTLVEDDFLVFPTQLVLRPNEKKSLRVQWVGETKLDKELSYRIVAEQLPVNFNKNGKDGAFLQFLVRYEGAIYITPDDAESKLRLVSSKKIKEKGKDFIELIFENQGKAHTLLGDLKLKVITNKGSKTLTEDELPGVAGENMLAGNKRRFLVAYPKGLKGRFQTVEYDFSEGF